MNRNNDDSNDNNNNEIEMRVFLKIKKLKKFKQN